MSDLGMPEIKIIRADERIAKINFSSHHDLLDQSRMDMSNNFVHSTNNSPDLNISHRGLDSSFSAFTPPPNSDEKKLKKRKKFQRNKFQRNKSLSNSGIPVSQVLSFENHSHQRNRISAYSKEAKMQRRPQYNQKKNLDNENLFELNLQ